MDDVDDFVIGSDVFQCLDGNFSGSHKSHNVNAKFRETTQKKKEK